MSVNELTEDYERITSLVRSQIATGEVRLDGTKPSRLWLSELKLSFNADGQLSFGELEIQAIMPEPVAFLFEPGSASPSCVGDLPFWHALGEAYTVAGPCVQQRFAKPSVTGYFPSVKWASWEPWSTDGTGTRSLWA